MRRRREPAGLPEDRDVGGERPRDREEIEREAADSEEEECDREEPRRARSVLAFDVAVHLEAARPEVARRRDLGPRDDPQAQNEDEVEGEQDEREDVDPGPDRAPSGRDRAGDFRLRRSKTTGSREFRSGGLTRDPSWNSRPPFAERTPAANSRTRRPHQFFSSLPDVHTLNLKSMTSPSRDDVVPAFLADEPLLAGGGHRAARRRGRRRRPSRP